MKRLTYVVMAVIVLLPLSCLAASTEVAFSPNGGATALVVKAIGEAHRSIRVAAYSFTSKPIARALMEAKKRGIDVRVVLDSSQATERYSSAHFLANVGIPVRIDYRYAIMHNKFIVVDDEAVETGSFNYTQSASDRNAENVIVLRDDPGVARQYEGEWQRLWDESEDMKSRY